MPIAFLIKQPRFYVVLLLGVLSLIPALGLEARLAGLFVIAFAFKQGFRIPPFFSNLALMTFTGLNAISLIYENKALALDPSLTNLLMLQGLIAIGLWVTLFSWLLEKSSSAFIYSAFAFIFFALIPPLTHLGGLLYGQNYFSYLEKTTITDNKAFQELLQNSIKSASANIPTSATTPNVDLNSLSKQTQQVMTIFIPSFLSLGMMIFYYFALRLSVNFIFPEHPAREEGLHQLRMPKLLIWPLIIGWGLIIFSKSIPHWSSFEAIIYNLLFLVGTLYFIQGLGILSYFFRLSPRHRFYSLLLIVSVFVLSFFLPMLLQAFLTAVLGLGFFDQWFNYRREPKNLNNP